MISPCMHICDNKTLSGYCQTTACINPKYSNIGTAQYGQGVQKRVITNADRIRAMSDEGLAEFISDKARTFGEEYEGYMSALDWLKQEVNDG